ncbi:MAG: hypothetical protein J6W81_03865 [Lentisphaeria bacterium]|nr:hypothetical protein [Lentisphaeria bacterium]
MPTLEVKSSGIVQTVFGTGTLALAIRLDTPAEAIRNERHARLRRFNHSSYGNTSLDHGETLASESSRPALFSDCAFTFSTNPKR